MTTTTPKRFDAGLTIAERVQSNRAAKLERYRALASMVAEGGELTGKQVDELTDILDSLRIHHSHFTEDCEALKRIKNSAEHNRTAEEWAAMSEAMQTEYAASGAEVKAARESLAAAEARNRRAEIAIRNNAALRNSLTNEKYQHPRLFSDAQEYVEQHTDIIGKAAFTH